MLIALILGVGGGGGSWADQTGGERISSYLQLGAGGVVDSMGGTAAAFRGDATAGFWNPAGLAGTRGTQLTNQVTLLPWGQELNYFAFSNGYRDVIFYGFSFFFYSAGGDIEARQGPSLEPDSVFGDSQMTFLVSLAFKLDPRWSLGGNLKVLTESFNNFSGLGFGEDLGLQFRVSREMTLGLVVQDPATFMDFDNHTESFAPPTLRGGMRFHRSDDPWTFGGDLEWSFDQGLRPRGGVQWALSERVLLRGGAWAQNITGGAAGGSLSVYPTGGAGFLFPMGEDMLELDYALLPDRTPGGIFLHQFSLGMNFI